VRLRSTRTALAALLAGLALAAAVPAQADDVPTANPTASPTANPTADPAANPTADPAAPTPGIVAPYGADQVGVPMFRIEAGQHLPTVQPVGHPFKAIVTVAMPGGDRSFRVFIPTGLVGPAPTVVAMGGWAEKVEPESYMHWEKLATARRFVVVYPRGRALSFNAGRCCGAAVDLDIDDSGAIIRMLEVENDLYTQNPSRLYLTGFSNGGMMAYRFACEHPERVAAIGVVAAAYVTRPQCMPRMPVPAMHIHGRLDATLPWRGTQYSRLLQTSLPTVPQTDAVFGHVNYWAGVTSKNVYLRGVGHGWPHVGGLGNYDATGQLAAFLLRFHR
jgi:poly(3-hydroxybutyrate) depolymerase